MKESIIRRNTSTHAPDFESTDIFKYGLEKDIQRTLENCTLGFSKLANYNDPFEASFKYIHNFKSKDDRETFFQERTKGAFSNLILNNKDLIRTELANKAVTCFSKSPIEPLMWAHYTSKHEGVCYCFDKDEIFDKYKYRFADIRYSNLFPSINFFDGNTSKAQLEPQIEEILLTKSDNWSYEKEFRFYLNSDELIHQFNPMSLQGVILGSRFQGKKENVEELITVYNKAHKTNVKLMGSHPISDSL